MIAPTWRDAQFGNGAACGLHPDRRFAQGEVVVLGDHFGVRITRILSPNSSGGQLTS